MEKLSIEYSIPDDLLFREILPKVPTRSLMAFKSVSKGWLARISNDSTFIADHTAYHHHHSTTELCYIIGARCMLKNEATYRLFFLGPTKLVEIGMSYILKALEIPRNSYRHSISLLDCCNGLVVLRFCDFFGMTSVLVIWNPVTREFRDLLEPTLPVFDVDADDDSDGEYYLGFGKDDQNDYKVVRLQEINKYVVENVESTIDARLFTKTSGRWRPLNGLSGFCLMGGQGQGLIVDGTMYWAISYTTPGYKGNAFDILSFDLCAEKFRELEGPPCPIEEGYTHSQLIEWKGCFGALSVSPDRKDYQVWLRTKTDDDAISSNNNFCWIKATTIDSSLGPVHYRIRYNNGFLLLDEHKSMSNLFRQLRRMLDNQPEGVNFRECFYLNMPSLVSPY